jgi:PAS domain S-box-containing protein
MMKLNGLASSEEEQLLAERVELLHEHLGTSLPIAFLCASIIFYGLSGVINSTLLFTWYISFFFVFLVRFYLYKLYTLHPHHAQRNLNIFIIGCTLSALMWGIAGTLLIPQGHILSQAIVIIIIAGVSSGSVQTLQASPLASTIYILLSVLPLDIWLLLQRTENYFLLSMSLFLYIIFMLITCKRGHNLIMSALMLRHENMNINLQLEDINKLLKTEIVKVKKNEKSLAQLAEIVRYSKDAIIGLDTNGVIQSWNKGAEMLYGFSEREMIGKSITLLTPTSQKDLLESMLEKVTNNLSFQNVELERQHKLNHLIPVSVTLSPIKNSDGTIIGISSMDRDVSERKEIDKVKNEFISVVSHELRTPLTSIKGSIGLLIHQIDTMPALKMSQLLEIAYNNCDRLIRLINDILDIEKIESGKLEFKTEIINLNALIFDSLEENQSFAAKFQVKLCFKSEDEVFISGDKDRLMQVMTNLISNAVKFSPPHSNVDILLSLHNNYVRVSVTDHGMGIPREFQPKIFGKFTQADASSTRNIGGTGLGLSICKAILEKHHSHIDFITEEGKGSCFYFDLLRS